MPSAHGEQLSKSEISLLENAFLCPAAKKPVPVPEGMVSIDDVEPDEIEVEDHKDMTKVPGGKAGGAASGAGSAARLLVPCLPPKQHVMPQDSTRVSCT